MTPSQFKPIDPEDFIGPAGKIARLILAKAARVKVADSNMRALFYGPPGTGKTALARVLARHLAGHELAIEHLNGQSMAVDRVRDWQRNTCFRPLYGDRTVKVVDEIDKASEAAQAEVLTYLDNLPPGSDFIATTNLGLEQLAERLQTRFIPYKFKPAAPEELADFLAKRWELPVARALRIAVANKGNIRAALLDTERELDRIEAHET